MTGAPPAGRVLTVTPNPALDETYTVTGLVPGATHRVGAPFVRAGGKGLNVARVLHQQGVPVLAVAPVGGATGGQYRTELAASGIPAALVPITASTRRSLAFHDSAAGDTTLFNEAGPPLDGTEWSALQAQIDAAVPDAGCVVGSGSLPPGAPEDFYAGLVRRAGRTGIPAIIDATGPALLRAAEAGVDALKPNAAELSGATGTRDPVEGARLLIGLGARRVFVSCGEDGMLAVTAEDPDGHLHAALPRPLRGNATGAGDAAVAALAALLASGRRETEELLRKATAWSAAAVLMPAAGEIHVDHRRLAETLSITRRAEGAGTPGTAAGRKDTRWD